jgi:uncharacterized protein
MAYEPAAKPGPPAYQLIELLVFLSLIVPSMILSFFVVRMGSLNFVFAAVSTIVRDLSLVALVLYFIWRNGETWAQLGWRFRNSWQETLWGIALFLPVFFGALVLDNILRQAGLSAPGTPLPKFFQVQGPGEIVLAFILVVTVAVIEETIFRGYLLLRFKAFKMSNLGAALLSAVIFSLGHGYEGASGVVTVGAIGFAFAWVYLWRGSLVAPMVMHFLQDFTGIILPALLGVK